MVANDPSSSSVVTANDTELQGSSGMHFPISDQTPDLEAAINAAVRRALDEATRSRTSTLPEHHQDPESIELQPTSSHQSATVSEPNMAAVSLRIVPLHSQDPRVWFHMVEAQFELTRITREVTKYHHLLCALNERVSSEVSDIIVGPLSQTPYSDLKKAIIDRLGESRQTQIHRLLQGIELGDLKPSQLLRKLLSSGGSAVNDEIIKTIWMKRLPIRAQEILAPTADSLPATKLAELADRLLETMSQSNVMSVAIPPPPPPNNDSSISKQISEIMRRLDQIDFHQRRSRSKSNQRSRSQTNTKGTTNSQEQYSSSSSSAANDTARLCFFHYRFKENARNCRPHCPNWTEFKEKN